MVNRVIWIYSPAQWIFGSIIWLVTLCFVYKWSQLTDRIKKMCFLTNPNKALRFRKQEINGKNYYDCKEVYDYKTNTSLLFSLHFGCKLIYLAYTVFIITNYLKTQVPQIKSREFSWPIHQMPRSLRCRSIIKRHSFAAVLSLRANRAPHHCCSLAKFKMLGP